MRIAAALLAWLPLAAVAQVLAPQYPGGYQPDFPEERPWQEQQTALPPPPRPENLVKVYVSAATSFEFFVDSASISVGRDGVVRFTLVARSPTGATNVSFEGIRCNARERKLYAFGGANGQWLQARDPRWTPIRGIPANRQEATLADDFFCSGGLPAGNAAELVRVLRRGGIPGADSRDANLLSEPR